MPTSLYHDGPCVPLLDQPAFTPRKLRVITIGAGYSGLIFAHKLQHEQPHLASSIEHTIYEANDGVGGTWKVNTYPGVQNDVPAHLYSFPFEPNPHWSKFYADGQEILQYMERTCDKWGLRRDIQFNSRVTKLWWDDDTSKWNVTVIHENLERTETADFVISAQGFLSRWKWPDIEGLHDFTGHKVHSADWDHKYDYREKRIGIIGNGSSAIQILPQMAKTPGVHLTSFQRSPTWITQSLGQALGVDAGDPDSEAEDLSTDDVGVDMQDVPPDDKSIGSNFNPRYSLRERRRFAEDSSKHRAYRKMLQHGMNKGFRIYRKNSVENTNSTKVTVARMRAALNDDSELCAKLIPDWTLGCRRLTPGEGYLESFLLPHVDLTQSSIERITPKGILTSDGKQHDLDVIICATGFDVSHVPHYPVLGQHGTTLKDQFTPEPESYLSLAVPNFPNFFIFTGPNATVGHGTLLTSMNWSADWMLQWLRKCAKEHIASIVPKQRVVDEFVRYGDEIHKTLVWTGGCKSWYKGHRKDGRVTATWPGSALLYREMIESIRPEDFEIKYINSRNRFANMMGNGFTRLEEEGGEDVDLAFYI